MKTVHVSELRAALAAVYEAYGFSAPSYTDSTLTAGETTLKKLHVSELRAAVVALDLPAAITPSFSPTPGTFNSSQNITLSSTTSGAAIRYTLDGSEPTIASSLYVSPIPLAATTTVRAKTFAVGNLPSEIGTGVYTFQVAAPTFNPPAGTYEGVTFVEVSSATPSVELRYTLDGSEPTPASELYDFDIQLNPISTTTIKVKGYRAGWVPSSTSSATYTIEEICEGACECPAFSPDDNEPDDEAINCLIAAGGTVTLSAGSPGYIIATGLVLNLDNVTIQGDGNGRPLLIAHPNLSAPMLRAGNYSNYTIRDLVFDGNRDSRQLISNICIDDYGIRTGGYNVQVKGAGFTVTNIYSQNALCGSALEVDGSNFTISHNHVINNGYSKNDPVDAPQPWSDGITLGNCAGGNVHHNTLENNSDVDLIVGPGQNCQVYENTVTHTNRYAYAGIMVGFGGDHSGSSVHDNTVTSALNLVSVGLMVGDHPWNNLLMVTDVGTVSGNTINGAVTLMWVEGILAGTVTGNIIPLENRQGNDILFNCGVLTHFAKGHWYFGIPEFGATIQDGADWIEFDNGSCTVIEP